MKTQEEIGKELYEELISQYFRHDLKAKTKSLVKEYINKNNSDKDELYHLVRSEIFLELLAHSFSQINQIASEVTKKVLEFVELKKPPQP